MQSKSIKYVSSQPKTYLGGFVTNGTFALFPHHQQYFTELLRQIQSASALNNSAYHTLLASLKSLIFDILSNRLQTFQEYEAELNKIKMMSAYQSCISHLPNTNIKQLESIKNTPFIEIDFGFYQKFQGLTLQTYLQRLSSKVGVKISLPNKFWIDKNCDKLSRLKIQQLISLNLDNNKICCQGVRIIVQNNQWTWLEQLSLVSNEIRNEGLKYLSLSRWAKIRILNLKDNLFTDIGVGYLVKKQWLTLQHLDIRTKRTQTSKFISKRNLDLSFCQLTYISIQHILQHKWYSLQRLDIIIGDRPIKYERRHGVSMRQVLVSEVIDCL